LSLHAPVRDKIVERIVERWPTGCPPEKLEDVLRARIAIENREKPRQAFIVSRLAAIVVRLVVDWWREYAGNRVLLAGWVEESRK